MRIGTAISKSLFAATLVLVLGAFAEAKQFTQNEKSIIDDSVKKFKRECTHIGVVDEAKLKEIHTVFQKQKDTMPKDAVHCYGEYLSQLAGTHSIYRQTCDEVLNSQRISGDADRARVFINIRKFKDGIRPYHEKLNDCLVRKGVSPKHRVSYSDYEKNGRLLSSKIRQIDIEIPFKENSVNYR